VGLQSAESRTEWACFRLTALPQRGPLVVRQPARFSIMRNSSAGVFCFTKFLQPVLYWRCNSYAYSADQSVPALLIPIRTHPIRTAVTLSVFIDSYSHTVL